MAIQTFPYRVRAGQRLPHDGTVYDGGSLVQLPRHVAAEVAHLADPIDADGAVIAPPSALEVALEGRPAHEHEGLLRRDRAELVQRLTDFQDVADRTRATADAAAAEVQRTQDAIAAIDARLEAPAPPPAATTGKARKVPAAAAPERITAPATPAEKE